MKQDSFLEAVRRDTRDFRSLPFWSWNDELHPEEVKHQISRMREAGIGGFFMHARGGLTTPYMQEDWMQAIGAAIEQADEDGMECWLYDENGWPSGFGNGIVPKMGEDYQQKALKGLVLEDSCALPEHTLGVYRRNGDSIQRVTDPRAGDLAVYVTVNQYYLDAMNAAAVRVFLDSTHEKYYEKYAADFGKRLMGFFTDEPQYGRDDVPWSQELEKAFREDWQEDITEKLGALFWYTPADSRYRWQYFRSAARLFQIGFIKQMGDWCRDHGVALTGHLMMEDSLLTQLTTSGGAMPNYEYFDMPGVDWLGRQIDSPVIPKQLGSAAAQLGKRQTLTESFALCGWDVSFNEMRWIAQWQFVNGVNRTCGHLSAYSLRGLRKRDYPASLHIQEPWFGQYSVLQDYFARTGAALSQGTDATDVLLIQPMGDAAGAYAKLEQEAVAAISSGFDALSQRLSELHLVHHYGDDTLISRYGRVENGKLFVGNCSYRAVILPPCMSVDPATASILEAFLREGGIVIALERLPELVAFRNDPEWTAAAERITVLTDAESAASLLKNEKTLSIQRNGLEEGSIRYCARTLPDGRTMYYLVSLSLENLGECLVKLPGKVGLKAVDLYADTEAVLDGTFDGADTAFRLHFAPAQSYILLTERSEVQPDTPPKTELLSFEPIWDVMNRTPNSLTLDSAEYSIDGGKWQPKKPIILIQKELLALQRPCNVSLRTEFCVRDLGAIGDILLAMETPEKFSVSLNGVPTAFMDCGSFRDTSIRCCSIRRGIREGKNELMVSCRYTQPQLVYDLLFGENVHEAELNKLTYDSELESMYLVGTFDVKASAAPEFVSRRAIWAGSDFTIVPSASSIALENITVQGLWFFAGNLRARQKITVHKKPGVRYLVAADALHVPCAVISVNGTKVGTLALTPYTLDVTDALRDGENAVDVELCTGCRNLFGPHHRYCGESYSVGPLTFTDDPDWSDMANPRPASFYMRQDYAFVSTGIHFRSGQV